MNGYLFISFFFTPFFFCFFHGKSTGRCGVCFTSLGGTGFTIRNTIRLDTIKNWRTEMERKEVGGEGVVGARKAIRRLWINYREKMCTQKKRGEGGAEKVISFRYLHSNLISFWTGAQLNLYHIFLAIHFASCFLGGLSVSVFNFNDPSFRGTFFWLKKNSLGLLSPFFGLKQTNIPPILVFPIFLTSTPKNQSFFFVFSCA